MSMGEVAELPYETYVIAHQSVEKKVDISKIVTDNNTRNTSCPECLWMLTRPMTKEEVLAKYMKTLHINQREGLNGHHCSQCLDTIYRPDGSGEDRISRWFII